MTKYLISILKKPINEMSLKDWYEYMNNEEILQYKLSRMNFMDSKCGNTPKFKELFPHFADFHRFLKTRYYYRYLMRHIKFYKNIYNKFSENRIRKSYLIKQIFCEMEGEKKLNHSIASPINWIKRGYSVEEAKDKATEIGKSMSPMNVSFWINRGFTLEEAKKHISLYALNGMNKTPSSRKYWEKFTYEHLLERLKEYTDKYGEEIVKIKKSVYTKDELIHILINIYRKSITKSCFLFYMRKGYNKEEAKVLAEKELDKMNPLKPEHWIEKGYINSKDIEEKLQETRIKLMKNFTKNLTDEKGSFGGKDAKLVFDYIYTNLKPIQDMIETCIYGFKDKYEYSINVPEIDSFSKYRKKIFLDFYIRLKNGKEIDIEYDSTLHNRANLHDYERDDFLLRLGFKVYRVNFNIFGRLIKDYTFLDTIVEDIKKESLS